MDLRPYICKQCGAAISPATLKCEYCGTPYKDKSLSRIVITPGVPGEARLRAEVRIDRYSMERNPERARDYALKELRNQLADGLLAYMKITTSTDFSAKYFEQTEIIRGEVRVVDPMFNVY